MTGAIERASTLAHATPRRRLMVSMAYELDVALRRMRDMAQSEAEHGYAQGIDALRVHHDRLFDQEVRRA